ncbi:arylsulfatase [Candidatus Poriferisodalis sp.]|uniref:arylsulfatase n=1 Tax=Candidatus Poriferisodalis sp. TaxID=3101277 RepID=UPI003B014895
MRDRERPGTTAAELSPAWETRPSAPAEAPNVVVIVFDDTGFAHFGCYGSDIDTPNIDRLAAGGLRYTNFHTTALCSPTRACLLSGRNHHSVGMRFLSNVDTGFSNCRGVIAPSASTFAEVLGSYGYATFALGKWHLANLADCGPAGPFDHWPLGRGFDRFYGFLGGATDQFSPELVIDNHPVDPPSEPDYHLSEDLVDQAISMIAAQQATAPSRRFLTYLAFGATHSPHQAPQAYLDKYRGRYDEGWDVTRDRWFARQRELGVVPAGAELSPRNPGVQPWDELDADQRRLYSRMQETFAAFLDHTDDQIGRLVDYLNRADLLDDTLIVLLSDNGASQEGGRHGLTNENIFFNRQRLDVADMVPFIDQIGGPNLYNNYPWGWAQAGNTPLRFYKQNTYEGGIRDPLIVHWPSGIADAGGIRDQYHHVIDLMPTILDVVGVEAPAVHNGIAQQPVEGISMRPTFDPANAETPSARTTQYYEMLGHRAIYHDGWKAVTLHRQGVPFSEDEWALYDTRNDFAEIHDLSEAHPDKLRELIELWWDQAGTYNVLPLDDRGVELFVLRRPGPDASATRLRYPAGMPHLERFKCPDVRNRSFEIAVEADTSAGTDGVLVAYGSRTGGLVLYVDSGVLCFEYNNLGRSFGVRASEPVPSGEVVLGVRYAKSAEHTGTATVWQRTDGEPARELGSVDMETMPFRQSLYGMDVGRDLGPTVTAAYAGPNDFQGVLRHVEFRLDNDRDDLRAAAEVEARNALVDQ